MCVVDASKEDKQVPAQLMRELVVSTVKMINSIRRKGRVHLVMSPRLIVTKRKIVLPPYPPKSHVYGVKGGTTNNTDNWRTFPALYLRPNDERGRHFVYNIHTIQRCSACQVIGIKKKPILMGNNVIETINTQVLEELCSVEFADINIETTINNYEERSMSLILILKMMINPMKQVMTPP